MNNEEKEKISKSTVVLIGVLTMVYALGFLIYPSLSSCVKEKITPKIQKEYYVDLALNDENGEVAKEITAEEAYIVPLSKAISLLIMMVVIISIAYFVLCKAYKKGISFRGISKIVKILESLLILVGIFVFIFKLSSMETKYGIYKDTLNEETDLSYYKVIELPVVKEYLHNEKMNIFEEIQMIFLVNTGEIVRLCEIIISISGAMLLPLKYCASIEDEKKKQQDYEKIKLDVYSQVTGNVLRKLKKENKF